MRLLTVSAIAFLVVPPAAAQRKLELTPFWTAFIPVAAVGPGGPDIDCGRSLTGPSCGSVVRQQSALGAGGRLTAWKNDRLALDLSLTYELTLATQYVSNQIGDVDSHLIEGSARLLYVIKPHPAGTEFFVVGGAAFNAHRGAAYRALWATRGEVSTNEGSGTPWGPVVGAGFRYRVTRDLLVRIEAEDYIYSFSGDAGMVAGAYPSHLQNDVVLSCGASYVLLGRGGFIR